MEDAIIRLIPSPRTHWFHFLEPRIMEEMTVLRRCATPMNLTAAHLLMDDVYAAKNENRQLLDAWAKWNENFLRSMAPDGPLLPSNDGDQRHG